MIRTEADSLETASQCIECLARHSKTDQHELIEQMLVFYEERGTKDLSKEQMASFIVKTLVDT